jgi:hypothetical protein
MTFYNVEDYPFLMNIQRNVDVIINELARAEETNPMIKGILNPMDEALDYYTDYWVKDNGFHLDQLGYDIRNGKYSTLSIFKKDYPNKLFDVDELFPNTTSLLKDVPGLYYCAFFKMYPKTELATHTHNRKHLIFHLLLNDLIDGSCELTCGSESRNVCLKSDSVLFDYSNSHGSVNNASNSRLHFVVDFNPFH